MKNNNRKKVTAVILLLVVVLLGGAAFYVSTLLQKATVPTAPTSNPRASQWLGGGACDLSFVVPAPAISCDKTVNDSDTAQTEITTVPQNHEIYYKIKVKNTGTSTLTNVKVSDPFGDSQTSLTFVSASDGCTFDANAKTLNCTIASLAAGATKEVSMRVKVAASAANGQVINNNATVASGSLNATCSKSVTVSGVVSCNNTCTTDSECSSGLKCISNSCRKEACADKVDCTCPTTTTTVTTTAPTSTVTTTVTSTVTTAATTTAVTTATTTTAATRTATATQAELPGTGILNLPGAAAFGGGLVLTVLGILFAL